MASQTRVHCLTNPVAVTMTAQALTALGFNPSMSCHLAELADLLKGAGGLLVNLGMLDQAREAAIHEVSKGAFSGPILLDPVMVHLSPFRRKLVDAVLPLGPVIKGNRAEIAALADALSDYTLTIVTGPEDEVRWRGKTTTISGGHPMLARISGTGCLAGGVLAGFLARAGNDGKARHDAAITALRVMREAAAKAGQTAQGPGTFLPAYLDALGTYDVA